MSSAALTLESRSARSAGPATLRHVRGFHNLGDEFPSGFWTTDNELRLVSAHSPWMTVSGVDPVSLIGLRLFDLGGDRAGLRAIAASRRALAGNDATFVATWGGRNWEGHVQPLRTSDGTIVGTIGFAMDATERRLAARDLRDGEARFRALFAGALDGILILDDRARFVEVNPEACVLYGRTREDLIGRSIYEFEVLSADVPDEETDWSTFLEKGEWRGEVEIRRPDDSVRSVEFSSRAHFAPGLHLSFARDVTERRGLEAMLAQSQKLEAIGRLAGGVAHDFNNILTAILGYTELIASDPATSHLAEELAIIENSATRAAGLTRQLLAFSRRQVMRPVALDLHQVITDLEPLLRRTIGEDIELNVDLRAAPSTVRADPTQVEQILLNLVVNARDAMPAGGTLRISTRSAVAASAGLTLGGEPADAVVLTVADSGCGMDALTLARIFEPFFTTKPDGTGTGLGLATVYGIVEQSRGTIQVASTPGAGATFTISLPATKAGKTAPADVAPASATVRQRGAHVLIVEDEPAVRRLMETALRRHGFEVTVAANGHDAIRVASTVDRAIDVIVCDVVMPGMNGPQVAAKLRVMLPDVQVLFVSGYTEEAIKRNGVLDAASTLLQKPFTTRDLIHRVQSIIDRNP